ncbi:MAG: DUF2461 domain-containing protein [Flavobacteriaceae bacterium]
MISSTLSFLKQLKSNNNRNWFNENKAKYLDVKKDLTAFNNSIFNSLSESEHLDYVKMFRIYRDTRFSKNKEPYKNHIGIAFHRIKPHYRGGYYIHIEPGNSFLGAGFWDPNKEDLHRIRKEFEIDDNEIREIINSKPVKTCWGELKGDELKTAPRGYDKNHKAIDLIRKKQYVFIKPLSEYIMSDTNLLSNEVISAFKIIRPYFDYMSDVLTTDLNGESLI